MCPGSCCRSDKLCREILLPRPICCPSASHIQQQRSPEAEKAFESWLTIQSKARQQEEPLQGGSGLKKCFIRTSCLGRSHPWAPYGAGMRPKKRLLANCRKPACKLVTKSAEESCVREGLLPMGRSSTRERCWELILWSPGELLKLHEVLTGLENQVAMSQHLHGHILPPF